MNWLTIVLIAVPVVLLVAYLIYKNQQDEKVFEDQLNNDYLKPKNDEGDVEIDELAKEVH